MTRLTLTLHAPGLHKAARDAGAMWQVLNPGERKAERPWVAHITGFDDRYTFAREFVRGEVAKVNRKRHNYTYTLTPGLYEVNAPTAYDQADRYYLLVEAHDTLRRAIFDGRLTARKSGERVWLTSHTQMRKYLQRGQ